MTFSKIFNFSGIVSTEETIPESRIDSAIMRDSEFASYIAPIEARMFILESLVADDAEENNVSLSPKTFAINLNNVEAYDDILVDKFDLQFAIFYKIEVSRPCRIRAYNSSQARQQDAARPTYQQPSSNNYNAHGCVFDIVVGVNFSPTFIFLAPIVFFGGESIFLRINNFDAASNLNLNFSYIG